MERMETKRLSFRELMRAVNIRKSSHIMMQGGMVEIRIYRSEGQEAIVVVPREQRFSDEDGNLLETGIWGDTMHKAIKGIKEILFKDERVSFIEKCSKLGGTS